MTRHGSSFPYLENPLQFEGTPSRDEVERLLESEQFDGALKLICTLPQGEERLELLVLLVRNTRAPRDVDRQACRLLVNEVSEQLTNLSDQHAIVEAALDVLTSDVIHGTGDRSPDESLRLIDRIVQGHPELSQSILDLIERARAHRTGPGKSPKPIGEPGDGGGA